MEHIKRTVIHSVAISEELRKQLRTEAEKQNRSVSYLIREAINNYLKTINQPRQ